MRSIIAKENTDGSITAIHCQFGGQIENGVGETLLKHYTKESDVNKLLELGYILDLGVTPKLTSDYYSSFGGPLEILHYNDFNDFTDSLKNGVWAVFAYLFKDGKWYVANENDFSSWSSLNLKKAA